MSLESGRLDSEIFEVDSEGRRLELVVSPQRFNLASVEEQALFGDARAYFDQGNYETARSSFETFLLDYPSSPLSPDVYLTLSEIYPGMGEMDRVVELLETFLELFPDETRVERVQLRLTQIYFSRGAFQKVMRLWDAVSDDLPSKGIIYDHLIKTYRARNERLKVIDVLMKKREMLTDFINPDLVAQDILALVRGALAEEELQSLVQAFEGRFPADEAMIRLIRLYDAKEDYYQEEREIIRLIAQFPSHHFVPQARHLLDQMKDKIRTNRYLIAVILPLSGKLAVFGNNALRGAELALSLFKKELPGASLALVVRDSEGDPSRVRVTLDAWLKTYQPLAVVGPLLSKEVNRVAKAIQKTDIALISPGATSTRLFSLGESVFRNAVTNRFLCHAIAEYAVIQLEVERFAVLFPDEPLGRRWVDCFSEGVVKLGAEVVLTEAYPLNNTDFSRTIRRLKRADLAQGGFMDDIESEDGKIEQLYTPGFEAIFLPADALRAGLIIPQLLFHELSEVVVLGTNAWNSPEFLDLVGLYAEGVVFVDGFFKESRDPVVQTFVKEFRARFKREPDLFAAQSYDAMRLILAALKKGALTSGAVKKAITETIDLPGASGFIYEVIEGEVIKEPFYIQVEKGKFTQVN